MVVGDLFSRQCKPWKAISQNLVELIHEAALSTITKLLSEICDNNTKSRLMKGVIQPALYKLRQELQDQLTGFLEPHLSIHPISYNADLVEDVQNIQAKRHKRKFDRAAHAACKFTTDTVDPEPVAVRTVHLSNLLHTLLRETEPDVRQYSASLALDVSEAYYRVSLFDLQEARKSSKDIHEYRHAFILTILTHSQVALKKFVDDLSVNAVETYLIQRLPDV